MGTTPVEIALLFVTSVTTLAAFGGKTWKEGQEPILERITPRGWLALLCLVLALSLGSVKVLKSKVIDDAKKAEAAKAQQAAEARELAYKNEAKSANDRLIDQVRISNLEKQAAIDAAKATQDRLDASQALVKAIQTNLESTRKGLTEQSQANLISALSNSKMTAQEIWLLFPLRRVSSQGDGLKKVLLAGLNQPQCHPDVELIEELSGSSYLTYLNMMMGEVVDSGSYSQVVETELKGDWKTSWLRKYTGDTSFGDSFLAIRIIPPPDHVEHFDTYVAEILDKERVFTITAPEVAVRDCMRIGTLKASAEFDKGILIVTADRERNETISFKLQADPLVVNESGVTLGFRVVSSPQFMSIPFRPLTNSLSHFFGLPQ